MANVTPADVQVEVIARKLVGESKSKIAENLGIHRDTVTRILNDTQIQRINEETKSELISGTLGAAKRIVKDAKKNTVTAFEYLDRMGILTKRAESTGNSINVGVNFEGLPGLK